ncbi:MAG: molecular chaperone [Alphaproteobacteria bacterium]|nr:molecular chaperone [Alphaproteobacteria bacterium]
MPDARKSNRFFFVVRSALFGLLLTAGVAHEASAQLLISPLRVVFEGRDRAATVVLRNQGDNAQTYRLEWQEKAATPDGQYAEVAEPGPTMRIASRYVRFSPRQVTLGPGETQQVRLALRLPAQLPPGEYRSHLAFVAIDETARRASRQSAGGGAAIQVFMNLGFAIPIMIRHGQGVPGARLGGAEFSVDELNRLGLKVQLLQDGNFSAYGRLKIFLRDTPNGAERQIGLLQNVALFPDIQARTSTVLLDVPTIANGVVRILYEGADEYAGRIWLDQSFQVGN